MLSSYQRDSTSGEPSDGDHLSSHALPSILQHTASPVSQLLLHSGLPPEAAFRSGPRLRPPVTTDSVSKLHVSATVYLLNRRCSSSFKTSLPARINTAGPQNRIYLKTFSNSTEPLTLNTVKNTLQRRSGKHCSPIRGSAPGIFPDKTSRTAPERAGSPRPADLPPAAASPPSPRRQRQQLQPAHQAVPARGTDLRGRAAGARAPLPSRARGAVPR